MFTDLETKLNAAIDSHNLANPSDKVEHAKFEIDVTNETKMTLKLQVVQQVVNLQFL